MEQEEFIQFLKRNTEVLCWTVVSLSIVCLGDSFHLLSFSYNWLMILTKIVFGISSTLLIITFMTLWKTWLKYVLTVIVAVVSFFGIFSVYMKGYELNKIYYSQKNVSSYQQDRVEVFAKNSGEIKYEKVTIMYWLLEYRQEISVQEMPQEYTVIWQKK